MIEKVTSTNPQEVRNGSGPGKWSLLGFQPFPKHSMYHHPRHVRSPSLRVGKGPCSGFQLVTCRVGSWYGIFTYIDPFSSTPGRFWAVLWPGFGLWLGIRLGTNVSDAVHFNSPSCYPDQPSMGLAYSPLGWLKGAKAGIHMPVPWMVWGRVWIRPGYLCSFAKEICEACVDLLPTGSGVGLAFPTSGY